MPILLSICESDLHFKNLLFDYIQRTCTYDIVDHYSNGFELINRLYFKQNNFLLIDVFTPIMTGIEAIKILRNKNNSTPIIAYSQVYQEDVDHLLSQYDQIYYCQKNSSLIFGLLSELQKGNISFHQEQITQWKRTKMETEERFNSQQRAIYNPSPLELQIINHACRGLTNKEIGEQVYLSGRTIEAHIKKLTEKFRVKNKIQLITYCVEQNLHTYK
ncbi:response regulator transcription factor [Myroides sp. WP-1]|uniref:response regulator transcription factor n=1 Tax=Myroides sp. WP-1 TaxID=2759944 RepID=UPI0015FA20BD|nr:response regulator transcription factor [Myroides sp. WP-1]MBB1139393.1 response regulator transcription factor [Myroides sp. WP-1]